MRTSIFASTALAALVAFAAFVTPGTARADDAFDVSAAGGKITVVTKGSWHINKDFPWSVKVGDAVKADKSKFTLGEKEASVAGAPKGTVTLKGAVCSGDTCKPFSTDVVVK